MNHRQNKLINVSRATFDQEYFLPKKLSSSNGGILEAST
jgi:hypothetical protein